MQEPSYESCLEILNIFYEKYNWGEVGVRQVNEAFCLAKKYFNLKEISNKEEYV